MPRIAYESKNFRGDSLDIIQQARMVCQQYASDGYGLTLRQLYYQFVARGWLANSDKNYKRLGNIVNDARMAGLIDWYHLDDRHRHHSSHPSWASPDQIISAAADGFQRDPWVVSEQAYRPEVWVEKDALAGIVERACRPLRVSHFACKGYPSASALWRAGQRMRKTLSQGFTPIVIHLGDHDPSGIDMTRDIEDRLRTFAGRWVEVRRIALNMDQVEEYDPPPNPAKITDSRAEGYISRFGDESWELDALEPSVLDTLIQDTLEGYVDRESFEQVEREDEEECDAMREIAGRWGEIRANWDRIEELLEA